MLRGLMAWHGIANLQYMVRGGCEGFIRELISFCEVPRAGGDEMRRALDFGWSDLEDAMQCSVALVFRTDVLVTRNLQDYKGAPLRIMSPSEVLSLL